MSAIRRARVPRRAAPRAIARRRVKLLARRDTSSATNYKCVTTRAMPDVTPGAPDAPRRSSASSTSPSSSASARTACTGCTSCCSAPRTGARIARGAARRRAIADEELPRVTIQLPLFNESTVAARLLDAVARDRLPGGPARDPGARRLDRRDAGAGARPRRAAPRARHRRRLHAPRRSHRLQGGRARRRASRSPRASSSRSSTPTSSRQPDFLRAIVGHFHDPKVGHGADALGPHEPRRLAAHPGAGADARRPPPGREPRALRRRAALQLLRHRRHLAPRGDRRPRAAGSTTRSPRISISRTARSSPAGSSSTARTWSRRPSSRRTCRRVRAQQYRWAKGTVQTARKLMRRVLSSHAHASTSGSRRSST